MPWSSNINLINHILHIPSWLNECIPTPNKLVTMLIVLSLFCHEHLAWKARCSSNKRICSRGKQRWWSSAFSFTKVRWIYICYCHSDLFDLISYTWCSFHFKNDASVVKCDSIIVQQCHWDFLFYNSCNALKLANASDDWIHMDVWRWAYLIPVLRNESLTVWGNNDMQMINGMLCFAM